MTETIRCYVCNAEIYWRAEAWAVFWRRIWRRLCSPFGDSYGYALDAFTVCNRAACRPYVHFWSGT